MHYQVSNPDNSKEVTNKIINEVLPKDATRNTLFSNIMDQIRPEKLEISLAALKVIDRLSNDPDFIQKQIDGGVIEPYIRLLDADLKPSQVDPVKTVFPAKVICFKVLQEIIEGEEADEIKVNGRSLDLLFIGICFSERKNVKKRER